MRTSPKTLVFYVTLLVAVTTFLLVNECNAQRGFGRLPFRQQQIENRVRQISPQNPAAEQKPTSAAEEKAAETPAPAVKEKAEETPAPAAKEKAEEAPAPAAKEKAKEAPTTKKKAKETPSTKKKAKEAPAVKEKTEASILEEKTTPPAEEKKASDSDDVVPDLDEFLSDEPAKDSSSDPLHEEAVEQVLTNPNVPEEAKNILKQATKEDIQKSVEEATAEVEADNQNEHIDGVVENSRKEVDEDAIETAVNEVLESSDETLKEEEERSESSKTEEEVDDSLPDSVNQVIDGINAEKEKTADADADEDEDEAEEDADEDEDEAEEEDADEDADKAKEDAGQSAGKKVKMDDLDQELKVPENATFDQLHEFLTELDSLSPADLDQTDQEVMMEQAKTFIEKIAQAKLAASNQMLALEGLTNEQWEEAVSWKVQSLVHLFQLDGKKIEEMRDFVKEVSPKASKEVSWKLESILIQMELAQITEEPTPEDLKKYVNRMLDLTQKGIDENCVSLDFVLATVQMVALTEDALPKEESKEIFESAIKTLNSSETPKLKEMAKFLQKILDQREITGKTPDLTLETYDGKTVKTADFVGKTLLIYCFQMSSRDQLQDLGLVYQIYLVFHERGLEVIGIVPEEKTEAMDELLKQIPWPMVFEGKDAEKSSIEKLCVPTLPTKVLVNAEGKIENANVQPMELLKYLESVYGPVSKPSEDEEAKETENSKEDEDAAEDTDDDLPEVKDEEDDEDEALDPPADDEDDEDEVLDPPADDEDDEDEALDPPADDETPKTPAKKVKEKVKEKVEEKLDDLDLDLDL